MANKNKPLTTSQRVWEWTKTLALAIGLSLGVRVAVAQAYEIDGPSMEPTLFQGERVWVFRGAFGLSIPGAVEAVALWDEPVVGDVVVLRSPREELDLIKRVVGIAGDTIEFRNGTLLRNGDPLLRRTLGACDESRHLRPEPGCIVQEEGLEGRRWRISQSLDSVQRVHSAAPVRVPPGHIFVLGDHRDRSNDSRSFGPVSVRRVRGRALGVR